MTKINHSRVLLGGLLAGLAMIVAEFVVELLILGNIPGLGSEQERVLALGLSRQSWGPANHVLQLLIPFLSSFLMVWLYAALRPTFGPGPKTALIVSAVFLVNWTILLVYFTNIGLFPLKISLASFLDNLIVIPIAVLVGARFYRERAIPRKPIDMVP